MRCKVVCNLKTIQIDSKGQEIDAKLCFAPVYNGSEENKKFFKYTPGGDFSIYTVNTEVAKNFDMGEEYYVDFSPAV